MQPRVWWAVMAFAYLVLLISNFAVVCWPVNFARIWRAADYSRYRNSWNSCCCWCRCCAVAATKIAFGCFSTLNSISTLWLSCNSHGFLFHASLPGDRTLERASAKKKRGRPRWWSMAEHVVDRQWSDVSGLFATTVLPSRSDASSVTSHCLLMNRNHTHTCNRINQKNRGEIDTRNCAYRNSLSLLCKILTHLSFVQSNDIIIPFTDDICILFGRLSSIYRLFASPFTYIINCNIIYKMNECTAHRAGAETVHTGAHGSVIFLINSNDCHLCVKYYIVVVVVSALHILHLHMARCDAQLFINHLCKSRAWATLERFTWQEFVFLPLNTR